MAAVEVHRFAPGNPYLLGLELPLGALPPAGLVASSLNGLAQAGTGAPLQALLQPGGCAAGGPGMLVALSPGTVLHPGLRPVAGLPPGMVLHPSGMVMHPGMIVPMAAAPTGAAAPAAPGATGAAAPKAPPPKRHAVTQDSWRGVKMEPEVQDLADHFGLDERIAGKLQEALDQRERPGEDLEVMWEILDEARNPPGLTMIKVKEMLEGSFRAGEKGDTQVAALSKRFGLDERATYKLSEVLATRANRHEVLRALETHLAASNNPSALVMLRLADLRKDIPLGEVPYGSKGYRDRPYLGTYDRDGNKVHGRGERGGRGGDRDRNERGERGDEGGGGSRGDGGGGVDRSRSRERRRSRSRSRRRSRSRSRSRSRRRRSP